MNVLSFIIFSILLGVLYFAIAKLVHRHSVDLKVIFLYLLICSDVILVLEIASLISKFDRPIYILVIQVVISAAALIANKAFNLGFVKINKEEIRNFFLSLRKAIRENRLLFLFGIIVSLNYAFLLFCSIRFPQNITDSLYNHLSRIGHWIQQGSLAHYQGFSIVGMIYPYNNGLLVSLPIILLKVNIFVGLTQFCAAFVCAIGVYSISKSIGFSKKASIFAGLLILSYPVILYQSITAQNDLLVASFTIASIAFLVAYLRTSRVLAMVLSLLALVLALGTKQYALLIIPGYAVLAIYGLKKFRKLTLVNVLKLPAVFLVFFLFFGSYSYLQNLIVMGNPFGPKGMVERGSSISAVVDLPKIIWLNSSRIFVQFISCDGLPPQLANGCLGAKEKVLRPILPKNIESDLYVSGPDPYILSRGNGSNSEMAFYGPLSWLLIIPTTLYIVFYSIKERNLLNLFIILVPIIFFYTFPIIFTRWSPYEGRFFMAVVFLLQPFTALLFQSTKWMGKFCKNLIGFISILIMIYATLNNASMPLTSKDLFTRLEKWGKVNSVVVQKIAYKLKPFAITEKDVWVMSPIEVMTLSNRQYYIPVKMVEGLVPDTATLGIVSDFSEFPDYLFMGRNVSRRISRIYPDQILATQLVVDFLLLDPEYQGVSIAGFNVVESSDNWTLLKKNDLSN